MGQPSPWDLAHAASARSGVTLFPIEGLQGADGVRHVIQRVWGEQVLPREMIRAFEHAGSVLYGARAGEECVGFVLGFVGFDQGLHLHSHMLGVVPDWQDRGVGYALKLAQRAVALEHGIEEVRWTYDPLQARNARFNLVKLGAFADRLLRDFYGEMADTINRGDRSDRFEVRWRLRTDRVQRALVGEAEEPLPRKAVLEASWDAEWPTPVRTGDPPAAGATVQIPADLPGLRAVEPELARRWREEAAGAFETCMQAGLVTTWFTADAKYVFEPRDAGGPAGPT
jgi:predicted GNAT superfamily acetyltransferase